MPSETTAVVRIRTEEERVAVVDRARYMLQQARTPVEAKKVADLAKAAETYARLQQLGEEAVSHARAICVDALALMGEMLRQVQKATGGRPPAKETPSRGEGVSPPAPTLKEQGITYKQASTAQALATVKEKAPEVYEQVRTGKVSVAAARVAVTPPKESPAVAPRHQKPKGSAGKKWHQALHEFYVTMNAIDRLGGIEEVAGEWSQDERKNYLAQLEQVRERVEEWIAQLEEIDDDR